MTIIIFLLKNNTMGHHLTWYEIIEKMFLSKNISELTSRNIILQTDYVTHIRFCLMIYLGLFDEADLLKAKFINDSDNINKRTKQFNVDYYNKIFKNQLIDPMDLIINNDEIASEIRKIKWVKDDTKYSEYINEFNKCPSKKLRISYYFFKNNIRRNVPDCVIDAIPDPIKMQLQDYNFQFTDVYRSINDKQLYVPLNINNMKFTKTQWRMLIYLLINNTCDVRNFGPGYVLRSFQFTNSDNKVIRQTKDIQLINIQIQYSIIRKLINDEDLKKFITEFVPITQTQETNLKVLKTLIKK
jgi:hypothetical protein